MNELERWIPALWTEVHIWFVRLNGPYSALDRLSAVLSEEERERARRFRFEHLRQEFTVAHWALRVLLGRYLWCAAERIRFTPGSHGKPALADPVGVDFNLSHSGSL